MVGEYQFGVEASKERVKGEEAEAEAKVKKEKLPYYRL
jgi:hypothetical protein